MFSILVCTEIVHQNSLHLDFLSFRWEREDLMLLLLQERGITNVMCLVRLGYE